MKKLFCDRCETELEDGPVGAYQNLNLEIRPSYSNSDVDVSGVFCNHCTTLLKQIINDWKVNDWKAIL